MQSLFCFEQPTRTFLIQEVNTYKLLTICVDFPPMDYPTETTGQNLGTVDIIQWVKFVQDNGTKITQLL